MGILPVISINEKGGLTLSTLYFCTISQQASTCWIWTIIQEIITDYNIYIYCWFRMERKRYTDISIWLLLKQWNLRLLYAVQYRNRLASGVGWLIVILPTITQKNFKLSIWNSQLTAHTTILWYCRFKQSIKFCHALSSLPLNTNASMINFNFQCNGTFSF